MMKRKYALVTGACINTGVAIIQLYPIIPKGDL
jgi:hypothetical protein